MIYLILSAEVEIIDKGRGEFKYSPLLKIGYTKDIDTRFDSYLLHNPGCKLLGTREGDTELESYFHSYYSQYKYPGRDREWFVYSQEIVDNFQTLQVGDNWFTKEEYIKGLREYIRSNISTPQELKEKYLEDLLREIENTKSEVEFDRDFHKQFTMSIWEEWYEKEIEYLDSFDFSDLLKKFPERINFRENPWKNSAEFYYRATADYRKMNWEDFQKIVTEKTKITENLLLSYQASPTNSSKNDLANTYRNNAKAYSYKNDYVAVNKVIDSSGNSFLEPVVNELVRVNEIRAFKIQQIDYADRFAVFSTIHNKLTKDDVINQKISEFIEIYDSKKTIYEKLKLLCEYGLSEDAMKIVLGQISDSDEIKSYYTALKPQRLKALGYNITKIRKELGIVVFSIDLLKESIYSDFKEGEKYTLSDLKLKLGDIYSSINYQSTPKANDIEKWFEVKDILFNKTIDGKRKRIKGYELLKSKRDILEERLCD